MKSLIATLALVIVGSTASATEFLPNVPEIQSIQQNRNMMPIVHGPNGPRAEYSRDVQTYITVNYAACAEFGEQNFQVSKVKTAEGYVVSVRVKPDTIDCMAVGTLKSIVLHRSNFPVLGKAIVRKNDKITEIKVPFIELH